MSRSRCAARPPPRTCRPRASPASTKATSMSAARRTLFEACRRCFASIFTDRAIVYRVDNGFDHFKVALSVGVMKMVRSDRASSGVIFTLDTESGFPRRRVHHRRPTGWARTSCKARSIPTNSTSTSRPSGKAIAPCCAARSGPRQFTHGLAPGPCRPTTRNDADAAGRSASAFCIDDDGRARARRLRHRDRGRTTPRAPATRCRWTSNGPRMPTTAGSTSSRLGPRPSPRAAAGDAARELCARGERHRAGHAAGRSASRSAGRRRARDRRRRGARSIPARRGAGGDLDQPGLGAGDEERGRDRHRPRRPDLPRRHRRARARACRPSSAPRAPPAVLPAGRRRHGLLRRGRRRPRLRGRRAVRGRPRVDARELDAAATADHGEPRQSRPGVPDGACCRTTASAWRGWSSSSASTSAFIRWRWCTPERDRRRRERARDRRR